MRQPPKSNQPRRKWNKPARTLAPDINRNNLPTPHPRHDTP